MKFCTEKLNYLLIPARKALEKYSVNIIDQIILINRKLSVEIKVYFFYDCF